MFQGFNQASRSAAPNLLAANAADERAEAAKRQQITNLALGAASLASPFLMPVAAAKTALDVKDYMQIANQLRTAGATGAGATAATPSFEYASTDPLASTSMRFGSGSFADIDPASMGGVVDTSMPSMFNTSGMFEQDFGLPSSQNFDYTTR